MRLHALRATRLGPALRGLASASAAGRRPGPDPGLLDPAFWRCSHTWRRAGVNTLRCLVGCSIGDLGSMAYLLAYHPHMAMGATMAISMSAGIASSVLLETTMLRFGRDRLPWVAAARTATGMSLVSMLAMEGTENAVTLALTDAGTSLASPAFWGITALSMAAGFVAPLPYNYIRLKKWGRACH
ncbi:hypothetical protein CC85DRAFT_282364 [Cutaneotrichosporon oleaginosum]|uniref:DUF4396 domain-containing protein n=1 Tax=Cutaneotrichosporon oleaginosum TaxID=879819 RepID=A0A0J1BCI3_9TREE|nr:uncharacterized protein CC85DRAFT_282364 [Cutaneotrichosporon oleaginosum]KLT45734.1 hypothetical protein CC85DRAFT_282364 [Cutaneotrichosporon oleaginosum]TXT04499.1 hypothetical protein COLE_07318 [Cutaneotrichosporon oleaginosum]